MASTLKQIAEIANVSRGTVDRVIHGRYGVDPKTRARVLAVMQELDYKPNAMAQALRGMQNSFRIGAIVPSEANPFYIDVNSGIDEASKMAATYGMEVTAGPSLLFDTMATVFRNMAGGRIWGTLFFLFMVFAAFSTELAVCENILACVREMTGWSRRKGSLVCGVGIALISLTTALGFSVIPFHPFGPDSVFLDFWDGLVSTHLLPLGALVFTLYCVSGRLGWGWDAFVAEANAGRGLRVRGWMRPVFTFVVPACIVLIYVMGIV